MPTTFLLGVVLGWIALSTGSLLPGIVCHAVHNTMPIVLLSIDAERAERLVAPAWVPLLAGLVAVVGGCLVARGGVRPGSPRSPDRARP
jgi:energy-converting hydrogenase Eha subunit G